MNLFYISLIVEKLAKISDKVAVICGRKNDWLNQNQSLLYANKQAGREESIKLSLENEPIRN